MKIGILGYGNLGRGVECAIKHQVNPYEIIERKSVKEN